jgi:NAD(P)-dependent dehydrogenase (short-subunit alcohol dehydrogenase family)
VHQNTKDDDMDISGKVAVVTGAGRGIGRAFALDLANSGAAVVVNDIDCEIAQSVVQEIHHTGGRAVVCAANIGQSGAAETCIGTALDHFGRLDVFVANAGVLRDSMLWKTDDDAFDLVIGTHLRGTFQCGRAAARYLRQAGQGGSLILIGSPAGQLGSFGQTAYAAAKAGIAAFARTWAAELLRDNITVNAIIPTALTRMTATIPGLEQYVDMAECGQTLPEKLRNVYGIGLPDDVSPLAVFLASDQGRDVTGQCIGIGGDRLTLWSHPAEIRTLLSDGGWNADRIADQWQTLSDGTLQPFGMPISIDV